MHTTHRASLAVHLAFGLFSGAALSILAGVTMGTALPSIALMPESVTMTADMSPVIANTNMPALLKSQAQKLSQRLVRERGFAPPIEALAAALQERNVLLQRSVTLHIAPVRLDQSVPPPAQDDVTLAVQAHPAWLTLTATRSEAHYAIDPTMIAADFMTVFPNLKPPVDAVITAVEAHDSNKDVLRAKADVHAAAGFVYDVNVVSETIAGALEAGQSDVTLPLSWQGGTVVVTIDGQTKRLNLIAAGRSEFSTSPWGRKVNIRKGLNERINGTLVAPGTTVSFNDTIGPISAWRGWAQGLAIIDGHKLEPMIGGGLCQVATTVYRSVLLAGLPVDERKPHSLYVHYYKEYGVGLDATVQMTKQDLVFRNDTPDYILFDSWTEGDEAFSNIYGVSDGRTVALEGPYFASTAPADLKVPKKTGGTRDLLKSEIGWIQRIRYADGTEVRNDIFSLYGKGIPSKTLLTEYPTGDYGTELMHTAAPLQPKTISEAL